MAQKPASFDKPIIAAVTGGLILGACTMFVPTPVLENLTMASGLSEIFPATAAPLGDTARALIAFGAGLFAMAVLLLFMREGDKAEIRQQQDYREKREMRVADAGKKKPDAESAEEGFFAYLGRNDEKAETPVKDLADDREKADGVFGTFRRKLASLAQVSRFGGGDTGISELSELKGRIGSGRDKSDVLILDTRDLGEPLPPIKIPAVMANADVAKEEVEKPERDSSPSSATDSEPMSPFIEHQEDEPVAPKPREDDIRSLLDRLETAVQRRMFDEAAHAASEPVRRARSETIKAIRTELTRELGEDQGRLDDRAPPAQADRVDRHLASLADAASAAPEISTLKSVATGRVAQKDGQIPRMDEGLRAALKTLSRMNAQAR